MSSPIIITKADFENQVELSVNLKDQKLSPHIRHAMDFDLRELMGDRFYYYFLTWFNPDGTIKDGVPPNILNLYAGDNYEVDSVPYTNPGIKPVLVYFAAARLIKGIDAHITPNGYRDKVNEFSEQVGAGRKSFQANEYENQALSYWRQVETFMGYRKDMYPEYFVSACGFGPERNNTRAKRVSVGGRDSYVNYKRFYNGRR